MNRYTLYHCGMDCRGNRHWRLKSAAAIRHCRQHARLFPRIVVVSRISAGHEVWRTGLQQRRWLALADMVRADRRSFLTTLSRPPLVSPVLPDFH